MDNAMAKNFMIESLFAIMKTELLYAEYSKALKSFTKALEESPAQYRALKHNNIKTVYF